MNQNYIEFIYIYKLNPRDFKCFSQKGFVKIDDGSLLHSTLFSDKR